MDWSNVFGFAVVATLLEMSPGPNGMLVARTVPASGRTAGFANIAGFVTAFYIHGALSILGISVILLHSAQAFLVVKIIGAGYLCWLGLKALREAWRGGSQARAVEPAKRKRTIRTAYIEGLLTNVFNPKVSMFYLAAFPQFMTSGEGAAASAFVLVMLHSLISAIWFAAIVVLFGHLAKIAQNGAFQRWLNGVTGAVFIAFGARLATIRP